MSAVTGRRNWGVEEFRGAWNSGRTECGTRLVLILGSSHCDALSDLVLGWGGQKWTKGCHFSSNCASVKNIRNVLGQTDPKMYLMSKYHISEKWPKVFFWKKGGFGNKLEKSPTVNRQKNINESFCLPFIPRNQIFTFFINLQAEKYRKFLRKILSRSLFGFSTIDADSSMFTSKVLISSKSLAA
ncbi:hypothetical protein BpHYR1_037734 [Brachionus plicatilis]|uniref:Uncharacterized protein n=1 Tax=Brachionus plicatilis TaxID=10195 RepID=A0A3M7SB56_BRAPC|nr:hypothetical protein BpHYR1_037734 [Brachionus plicatilis]